VKTIVLIILGIAIGIYGEPSALWMPVVAYVIGYFFGWLKAASEKDTSEEAKERVSRIQSRLEHNRQINNDPSLN